MDFMERILAIGSFLVLNDLCHFDIWGQNFLFNNKNEPKLIDFGFAFRPSKLQQADLRMRWRQMAVDHDTETPEVTLMLASQQNLHVSQVIRGLQREKPTVLRLASICGISPVQWATGIDQWSKTSQSFQQHDWLSCWKVYWPGFDAWSIGAVLLQVLEIQLSVAGFSTSLLWTQKGELIKSVIKSLCRSHPAHRLDAAEALSMLTAGSHPLIAAGSQGSEWIAEKASRRPVV
jgi:serine/threonine protein kinase